jgi:hypothetical protein
MFAYRPTGQMSRWELLLFDLDIVMGAFGDGPTSPLFGEEPWICPATEDPKVAEMLQTPAFLRAYWRAFRDAVNGPMLQANYSSLAETTYNYLKDAGIKVGQNSTTDVAPPTDFDWWLNQRRNYIASQLNTVAAPFAITSGGGQNFTVNQSTVTLVGTAPIEVATIQMTSSTATAGTLTWGTAVTTWNLPLTLAMGANQITVQGYDRFGQPLQPAGAYTKTITITRQ